MKHSHCEAAHKYARDVVSGKIPACSYVRLSCQRHLDDLKKQKRKAFPYRFDPAPAERICKLVQLLPHVKGEWAHRRQLITLEPWQKYLYCSVFGWLRKKDGTRRFREVYNEIPRKNSKSTISAGVGLYCFAYDDEFGAEVYSGATTEKQAWEVFRPARLMVKRLPMLQQAKGIQVNAKNLCRPIDEARFEPVIGNPGDGASPSCAIIDEYHEHKTPDLLETMQTGMGSRRQPLLWIITTGGTDIEGPCYDKRRDAIQMLEGTVPDDELFALIYTIDDPDDWHKPESLRIANPNMGVSVYEDYLLSQQRRAIKNASKQNTFKTKHLNIWCTSRAPYFNATSWKNCEDKSLDLEQFEGQDVYVGLDLMSKNDICSSVQLFPRMIDEKMHYYIFSKHYLPEAAVHEDKTKRYQKWVNTGELIETEGEELDFKMVKDDVLALSNDFVVLEVPHDPWNALQLAQDLDREGLTPVKIPQNVMHLSPAMKELNSAILAGRVHHDGNPVMNWMIGNVTAKEDANENVFPRKEKQEYKIDGAVAAIMAVGRAMLEEGEDDFVDAGFVDLPES